jgi:hypothetical protein
VKPGAHQSDGGASGGKSKQPATLFDLQYSDARAWPPREYRAILRHQLAARIEADLPDTEPGQEPSHEAPRNRNGPCSLTFAELFERPDPPLALLRRVKDFAKAHRDAPRSAYPPDIAALLYYASIAAALVRRGKRITSLDDQTLRQGFDWCLKCDWIVEPLRALFTAALHAISARDYGP